MVGRSLLLLIAIFAFTGSIVSAETEKRPEKQNLKQEISERQEENKALRMERLSVIKEQNEDLREIIKEKRASLSAEIKANREEFKAKLLQIRDARKKLIVENVDQKLNTINQNSTHRMTLAIERMEKLLDKFSSKSARLKSEGNDTSSVDTAVLSAEDAIGDAKEAVASQAAKDYTVQISTESALRSNVGQTMSQLRQDLKATHDIVKIAKQKVIDVARALAKIVNGGTIEEPSPEVSPTIIPSATEAITPTDIPSI